MLNEITTNVKQLNGSISSNLHYTQVSLAAGASGSDSRTYNGTMSGGIAVHDQE
ncbi:hypothetical protein ACVXHB_11725 [Escherichia coli]